MDEQKLLFTISGASDFIFMGAIVKGKIFILILVKNSIQFHDEIVLFYTAIPSP